MRKYFKCLIIFNKNWYLGFVIDKIDDDGTRIVSTRSTDAMRSHDINQVNIISEFFPDDFHNYLICVHYLLRFGNSMNSDRILGGSFIPDRQLFLLIRRYFVEVKLCRLPLLWTMIFPIPRNNLTINSVVTSFVWWLTWLVLRICPLFRI